MLLLEHREAVATAAVAESCVLTLVAVLLHNLPITVHSDTAFCRLKRAMQRFDTTQHVTLLLQVMAPDALALLDV